MARFFSAGNNVNCGTPSGLKLANNFTLAGWVYLTQTGIDQALISYQNEGYYIRVDSSGPLFFIKSQKAGVLLAATSLVANRWYHFCVTVGLADGSGSSAVAIYLNGFSDATGTTTLTFSAPSASLKFGIEYENTEELTNGTLAELGIWDVALLAAEVAALAAGELPCRVRPESLQSGGYWPLYGLASPEPDLSGNANNGTLTGTSYATHAPVSRFTWTRGTNPAVSALPTYSVVYGWETYSPNQAVRPKITAISSIDSSLIKTSPISQSSILGWEPITPVSAYKKQTPVTQTDTPLTYPAGAELSNTNLGWPTETPAFVNKKQTQLGFSDTPLTQKSGAETSFSNLGFETVTPLFVGKHQTSIGFIDSPLYITPSAAVLGIVSWLPETIAFVGKKQTSLGNIDAPLIQSSGSQTGHNQLGWEPITTTNSIKHQTVGFSDTPIIQSRAIIYPHVANSDIVRTKHADSGSFDLPLSISVHVSPVFGWESVSPVTSIRSRIPAGFESYILFAPTHPPVTFVVQRRTNSSLGTRVGSRQQSPAPKGL